MNNLIFLYSLIKRTGVAVHLSKEETFTFILKITHFVFFSPNFFLTLSSFFLSLAYIFFFFSLCFYSTIQVQRFMNVFSILLFFAVLFFNSVCIQLFKGTLVPSLALRGETFNCFVSL